MQPHINLIPNCFLSHKHRVQIYFLWMWNPCGGELLALCWRRGSECGLTLEELFCWDLCWGGGCSRQEGDQILVSGSSGICESSLPGIWAGVCAQEGLYGMNSLLKGTWCRWAAQDLGVWEELAGEQGWCWMCRGDEAEIPWAHFLLFPVADGKLLSDGNCSIPLIPLSLLTARYCQYYPNPTTPVSNHLAGNEGKDAGLDLSSLPLLLRAKITIWDLNFESRTSEKTWF